jgi:hypothetical protein
VQVPDVQAPTKECFRSNKLEKEAVNIIIKQVVLVVFVVRNTRDIVSIASVNEKATLAVRIH